MEIKLLTQSELIRTAKGFIKYGEYGYFDNTRLLGGVQVHCCHCAEMELNTITMQNNPFGVKCKVQIEVIAN